MVKYLQITGAAEISSPRDSLDSIVGTWAGPEVNLIKYQPGLSFLCDTNAY